MGFKKGRREREEGDECKGEEEGAFGFNRAISTSSKFSEGGGGGDCALLAFIPSSSPPVPFESGLKELEKKDHKGGWQKTLKV